MKFCKGIKLKSIIIVILILLAIICFALVHSCARKADEVIALSGYLKYFDDPEEVVLTKIDKFVFEDRILYNIAWLDDSEGETQTIDLILDYNTVTTDVTLCFWGDMEFGINAEVKELWNERNEKAISSVSFSQSEIQEISKEAIRYYKIFYN